MYACNNLCISLLLCGVFVICCWAKCRKHVYANKAFFLSHFFCFVCTAGRRSATAQVCSQIQDRSLRERHILAFRDIWSKSYYGLTYVSVSLDDVTRQYAVKSGSGYTCSICGKARTDFTAMKGHMEAIHFPSEEGYSCEICVKTYRSKHSLACHMSTYHRIKK